MSRPALLPKPKPVSAIIDRGATGIVGTRSTKPDESRMTYYGIEKSNISYFSYEDMKSIAVCTVTKDKPVGDNKQGTLDDPLMGPGNNTHGVCVYCRTVDCSRHYGLIDFNGRYIIHPECIKEVISVLTSVCSTCHSLLINKTQLKDSGLLVGNRKERLKKIAEASAKVAICQNRRDQHEKNHAPITACEPNKIYEKNKSVTDRKTGIIKFKMSKDGESLPMRNEDIYKILSDIPEEDYILLGFDKNSPPSNMIMRAILVMPPVMRPESYEGDIIRENNFTTHYKNILKAVNSKNINDTNNSIEKSIYEAIYNMYNGSTEKSMERSLRSLKQMLQSKAGNFRTSQMGKPNNYCARTVAGPASNIRFDYVGIPKAWERTLTTETKISEINIAKVREWLRDGKVSHIIRKGTDSKIVIERLILRNETYTPQIGDSVERYLQDDDFILVNRQPSLHKTSMMARRVRLGDHLTVKAHLSQTTPMNADFDGDEFNVFKPRNLLVEAEAQFILNVDSNLISSENSGPTMGLVMNSVTGAYLLAKEKIIAKDLFYKIVQNLYNKNNLSTLSARLRRYNVDKFSGKALLSVMFPADFNYFYNGIPFILEGVLISNILTKNHVGVSHRSIIQELYKEYGSSAVVNFLTDGPIIINTWLMERGFSVGFSDFINIEIDANGNEINLNAIRLEEELKKIDSKLNELGTEISDDPAERSLRETQIGNTVNITKTAGAEMAKTHLKKNNNPIGVMTQEGSGSKGSNENVAQMYVSVGQMYHMGKRLGENISGKTRTLPLFDPHDPNIEARGFIRNSFLKGLTASEFFFSHMAGRENLIDTALKTARTGANQRHMMKAFENAVIAYDNSLRNTFGVLFAPMYNSGYNLNKMVKTVNTDSKIEVQSFIDISTTIKNLNIKRGWVPAAVPKAAISEAVAVDEAAETYGEAIKAEEYVPTFSERIDHTSHTSSVGKPGVGNASHTFGMGSVGKITTYEKTKLIGARAMQLSNNAKPEIDIGKETDYIKIAIMEYNAGVLPIFVIRKFTDNSYIEVYPTLDLI